jgi:protein TonB
MPRNGKNGAPHAPIGRLAVAEGAAAMFDDDPLSKVLGLDERTSGPVAWLGYFLGAIALLLGMSVTARSITLLLERIDAQTRPAQAAAQEIDVTRDEPPPPPPPPAETAKPEEPAPVVKAAPREPPPPAPAPAQAAKVLAQEPDPNEPVDLTGNTFVQGNADSYAGGTTSTNGTSTRAVHALAAPTGVPNATGTATAPPPPGPDRSRKASVGGTEWSAPFPPEADTAQIDEAYVSLQIEVRADGTASAVTILKDPGTGFGREARRYALTQHFQPALDHDGTPIPSTIVTRVHFSR